MRDLVKGSEPDILTKRKTLWTARYLKARQDGLPTGHPWRHPQVRAALEEETAQRCAYCDSDLKPVAYGHIEHILPRRSRPELVVAWENLTLACEICNNKKSSYYSFELPLVNPYADEVDNHILFIGDSAWPAPGSDKGRKTIRLLELFRIDLKRARGKRIDYFASLVDSWSRLEGDAKSEVESIVREELESGEYKKTVESYLLLAGFPL